MSQSLPNIQSGGSLMLSWQVKDRHVLVIGGGSVGLSRVNHLLEADAKVTVVSKQVHSTLRRYGEIEMLESVEARGFQMKDLQMYEEISREDLLKLDLSKPESLDKVDDFDRNQKFALVLVCINDHVLAKQIYYRCKQLGLNVNLADRPDDCDFYFGSVYRRGSLQIMISTNGKSPRLCNRLKNFKIKPMFDSLDISNAVENLGYLRDKLRAEVHPGDDSRTIEERMEWNRKITDFYSIEDWCEMDTNDVEQILKQYPELPQLGTTN
ncbi:DEKNAAE105276 [Brettanomyces naardenensis]|uniref:precorrin-2 dehydrogenase n=1 Tax=Brettanomyces naardenensis TaxID=13370 RepID=A0A448YSP0_BRENA|nr:DEKNAAE105276 [Brettanomyces naardenensis]